MKRHGRSQHVLERELAVEGQPAAGTGPLAMNRPRHWQVEGNLLTLTTKDDAGNVASVGEPRPSTSSTHGKAWQRMARGTRTYGRGDQTMRHWR